jgi:hypothetical protein
MTHRHVTSSRHPTGPACSHDSEPCAPKSCSARASVSTVFVSCAVRERQVARPVSRRRAEWQGSTSPLCAADGTADSPELRRARRHLTSMCQWE